MSTSKNIILGVTGSIAAHKAADLCSQLTKQNYSVRVVLTADAQKFITPLPFKTLSRAPVVTDLYDETHGWQPAHIQLADEADLLLIESTYGDRAHPDDDPTRHLTEIIRRTFDRGGSVLIPAFALGRTQDLLFHLSEIALAGGVFYGLMVRKPIHDQVVG